MKKILSVFLSFLIVFAMAAPALARGDAKKLNIVCTVFPEYDWVRAILGDTADQAELTLLLSNGIDLHSFQPSASDIVKVAACDLFVYVGGNSDKWVDAALSAAQNKDMVSISLLDCVKAKEEEVVEGMQAEEEEEEEGVEYDEHVWLSLKCAGSILGVLCDALCALAPENAAVYRANTAAYLEALNALDARYQAAVDASAHDTILFADRFPFRYLADDYGLQYYAAFVGCSAESEASFETIAFLAGKVDALDLPAVLVIEGAKHPIAETVIANTKNKNQQIIAMNSLQSVTADQLKAGVSYLSVMEENLAALERALE